MAVYSMTGYASAASGGGATEEEGAAAVTVEARSVNGRFLDLAFRLPDDLRGLEPALRELAGGTFRRGKIEFRVSTHRDTDAGWPLPTTEQLNRLLRLEATVQGWMPQARGLSVGEVLGWCRNASAPEKLDAPALEAARRCVEALREARAREGERLVAMLMDRVAMLRELAARAEPLLNRKSTRLNSSHTDISRMPSSA